jgi:hypothetical protein
VPGDRVAAIDSGRTVEGDQADRRALKVTVAA